MNLLNYINFFINGVSKYLKLVSIRYLIETLVNVMIDYTFLKRKCLGILFSLKNAVLIFKISYIAVALYCTIIKTHFNNSNIVKQSYLIIPDYYRTLFY